MVCAHDEQPAGGEIEAVDMSVCSNQVHAPRFEVLCTANVGAGKVGAAEVGVPLVDIRDLTNALDIDAAAALNPPKARIRKILSCEFAACQIVRTEVDPT